MKYLNFLENYLTKEYTFFKDTIIRQREFFGKKWEKNFDAELEKFFFNDFDKLKLAIKGYCAFALDGMKLQSKFNQTKEYINKTYEEASSEVYQNRDYMMNLYLPGIYLSHFLWRHHYLQHIFFKKKFLKLALKKRGKLFFDIGIGTGFYSKEMLLNIPSVKGQGFDLSPFSIKHTQDMLKKFNLKNRYKLNKMDIIKKKPKEKSDYLVCIEVLEHLEDPLLFLKNINLMMKKNGLGLISAAINAPNADHIYLYRSYLDVKKQLVDAGFKIIDFINDKAYEERSKDELVPVNAAFIVTK